MLQTIRKSLLHIVLFTLFLQPICSFYSPQNEIPRQNRPLYLRNQQDLSSIPSLKSAIDKAILPTKRGTAASSTQQSEIEILLQRLESQCPLKTPARDPRMEGKWCVQYTTAPPPSNGQLGPFLGTARQIIDLENGTYINKLEVDPNEWLSAELRAKWFEWDGTFLEDQDADENEAMEASKQSELNQAVEEKSNDEEEGNIFSSFLSFVSSFDNSKEALESTSNKIDYGATSWKVDFETLSIRLFGIPLVTQTFEDTSRVWRMSYLDDEVRIVRAGRTGKGDDDFVFYMTRENSDDS